jgi:ABC-2 type transport system permease protein
MIWPVLAGAELRLLLRSPLAVVNAVLLPVALGVGWLLLARDTGRDTGGDAAAMQVLMLLGCTPYLAATTALASRRQELVLKRLRTTALSGPGMLAGLLAPYALLALGQAALLIGVTVTAGGGAPARWWPLLLGVGGGTVLASAFAVLTAAVTPAPELAQLTATPLFLGLFGGGIWLLTAGEASWLIRLAPGAPVADLCRWSWREPGASTWDVVAHTAPSLAALTATAALAVVLAARTFRWELRR